MYSHISSRSEVSGGVRLELRKLQLRMSRIYFNLIVIIVAGIGGFIVEGCSDPPQCIPGRLESCPCLPVGRGIQRCSDDGSRFLECECSTPIPQLTSDPLALSSSSSVSAITTAGQPRINSKSRDPSTSPRSLDVKRSGGSEETSMSRMFKLRMRQSRSKWWFNHPQRGCIATHPTLTGRASPSKLISEGCYRESESETQFKVRCEDPPWGPKLYLFFGTERVCLDHSSTSQPKGQEVARAQVAPPQVTIAALEPVIEVSTSSPEKELTPEPSAVEIMPGEPILHSNSQGDPSSSSHHADHNRSWYCLCYQERVQGIATHATACRPTQNMCQELTQRIKRGSSILVRDSLSVPCQKREGSSPWQTFKRRGARRSLWKPSSHPGAWWSSAGCFLPGGPASMKAPSPSANPTSSNRFATSQDEAEIPELSRPIKSKRSLLRFSERGRAPLDERCTETCRAHLLSDRARRQAYGVSEVPLLLQWGKHYADQVKFVKKTCLRVRSGKRAQRRCVNKVIEKCTNYCKRSHR